ncbi:hypothetical protein EV363DRAFT_1169364, partial [Boletus edulis]
TCRRHLASKHKALYYKWCQENGFESMLAEDSQNRRKAAISTNLKQSALDTHLREPTAVEKVVSYTDQLFREAAIEWLITTSQPLQAVEHPSFKKMIDIASRANKGVIIPNRHASRQEILNLFKKQMASLKERLNVSHYLM